MLVGSFPTLPRWPTSVRQCALCLTCPLPPPAIEHHHEKRHLNRSSPSLLLLAASSIPVHLYKHTHTRIHTYIHIHLLLTHSHSASLTPARHLPAAPGSWLPSISIPTNSRSPLRRPCQSRPSFYRSLARSPSLPRPPQLKIPSCGIPACRIARSEPLNQRRSSYHCELCPFPLRPSILGTRHPLPIHWPVTSLCRSVLYQQAAARVLSYQLFRCITASPQRRRRQTQSQQPASQILARIYHPLRNMHTRLL